MQSEPHKYLEALRGTQRHSRALRDNQRQSETISAHLHREAVLSRRPCVAVRVARGDDEIERRAERMRRGEQSLDSSELAGRG